MMCLTFGLFTQVSDSGPHGPLVFILISLSTKVTLIIHTKFQPNTFVYQAILEKTVDFNGFAIFSIGGHLVFSTRLLLHV